MSQTNEIASINSLLLQLPEPLQIETLHYVEYRNSRCVGAASDNFSMYNGNAFLS